MTLGEAVNRAKEIEGWFTELDMDTYAEWIETYVPYGGSMIEVGSWKGRSSYIAAFMTQRKNARLFCLDSWKGVLDVNGFPTGQDVFKEHETADILLQARKNLKEFSNVTFCQGNHRELHRRFSPESVDLVFIDGDHSYDGFTADYVEYRPLVKHTGALCGHDEDEIAQALTAQFPNYIVRGRMWLVPKALKAAMYRPDWEQIAKPIPEDEFLKRWEDARRVRETA